MTHNDNQRPFCKLVCKYVWHIRPWKGLVILLLGTIVQCSFVNYFTGSNLSINFQIKAWISIISFLYPFQPGLFMNFFSFGLAIVYSDIGHWLYWGILKVHKKGSILTFFFSIHNSIVCIVVFNWRSILSHLLTKLRSLSGTIALSGKKGCWLIVQVHVHNKKAAHTYIAIGFCNAEEPRMMMSIIYFF